MQFYLYKISYCDISFKNNMSKDYYEILGLKRDSTQEEVAQNYKKKVLRWHPKFAKQDQTTAHYHFSQISQAFQVLSDPIKRAFYDKYGWQKLKEGLFSQGQLKGGYRFANNPDQIFEKFFQQHNAFSKIIDKEISEKGSLFSHAFGGLNYKQNNRSQDLVVVVQCTLNQLYTGVAKRINYQRKFLNPDGRTTIMKDEQKLVEIKPGFGDDTVLTFQNQGHQNIHRTVSNLILKIKQIPHQKFTRKQNDLIYRTQISLAEAIDCAPLQIKTLDNRVLRVSIDEIVSSQTLKLVKGEGMPILSNQKSQTRGNLYIRFDIIFPKQLSQEVKNKLRKLLQQ